MAAASLAAYAVTFVEGEAAPGRVESVAHAVAGRGYSLAELHLVAAEVPFVPDFRGRLNLPALDQIVKDHREIRAAIGRVLTDRELDRLVERFPLQVDREQFGRCGYDPRGGSVWRAHSSDGSVRRPVPPPAPEGVPTPQPAPVNWLSAAAGAAAGAGGASGDGL